MWYCETSAFTWPWQKNKGSNLFLNTSFPFNILLNLQVAKDSVRHDTDQCLQGKGSNVNYCWDFFFYSCTSIHWLFFLFWWSLKILRLLMRALSYYSPLAVSCLSLQNFSYFGGSTLKKIMCEKEKKINNPRKEGKRKEYIYIYIVHQSEQ